MGKPYKHVKNDLGAPGPSRSKSSTPPIPGLPSVCWELLSLKQNKTKKELIYLKLLNIYYETEIPIVKMVHLQTRPLPLQNPGRCKGLSGKSLEIDTSTR